MIYICSMFFKRERFVTIAIIVMITLSACTGYQKILKSSDYDAKYTKAVEYYEKKDYYRAQQLFEELIPITVGSERGEEVKFYYAYCYYGLENYILAGYHFKSFCKTYPTSKHTQECEYLYAYCYYLDSPHAGLDQAYSQRAIDALQIFINKYPDSEKAGECDKLIDVLRDKLEEKSYKSAKLYYDIGDYRASVVSLKNGLIDYPDTKYREELLFLIVKSGYRFAENSIQKLQPERYQSTINEYHVFVSAYPESQHRKEADKIFEDAKSKIAK